MTGESLPVEKLPGARVFAGTVNQSGTLEISTAAIAERLSEHPLGKAILKKFSETSVAAVDPDRFYYIPGKGVACLAHGDEIVVGKRTLLTEWKIPIGGEYCMDDRVPTPCR